jgi:hypothetical protein
MISFAQTRELPEVYSHVPPEQQSQHVHRIVSGSKSSWTATSDPAHSATKRGTFARILALVLARGSFLSYADYPYIPRF